MTFTPELGNLARLLEISAEVARRIADARRSSREEIYDLADQIEDVSNILQAIVENDERRGDRGGSAARK